PKTDAVCAQVDGKVGVVRVQLSDNIAVPSRRLELSPPQITPGQVQLYARVLVVQRRGFLHISPGALPERGQGHARPRINGQSVVDAGQPEIGAGELWID